jgi:hypothetical protein
MWWGESHVERKEVGQDMNFRGPASR